MKKFELTDKEAEILEEFLKELSERFSNDGCNDFTMKNTEENVKFFENIIKTVFHEDDIEDMLEHLRERVNDDRDLCINNIDVLEHLLNKMFGDKGD